MRIARDVRVMNWKNTRGRDDTKTKHKWRNVDTEPTYNLIRWIGGIATRREQLARVIRDGESSREVGVNDNMWDFRKESTLFGDDWEVQRDDTRAGGKFPLLNNDERGRLQNPTRAKWGPEAISDGIEMVTFI